MKCKLCLDLRNLWTVCNNAAESRVLYELVIRRWDELFNSEDITVCNQVI